MKVKSMVASEGGGAEDRYFGVCGYILCVTRAGYAGCYNWAITARPSQWPRASQCRGSVRETGIRTRSGWLADVGDEPDALSWSRQRLRRTELGLVTVKAARVVWARERHETLGYIVALVQRVQ
jgi:hypothetical protein